MPVTQDAERARRRKPQSNPWLVASAIAAVVIAVAIVATVTTDSGRDGGSERAITDPGVAHVHGLGIDPADGTLYVATHHGMFRIPEDGSAERVGDTSQDTMGFTVVGPSRFLGSGHPDLAGFEEGRPSLLGLIESTDAGQTWRNLSLAGEADFHALVEVHDRVYGWDATSTQFMVATDGEDWDARSRLDLTGLAVDPADAERIVAATPAGARVSTDGGRSWGDPAPPVLAAVSWAPGGVLWGIGPSGEVHRSDDGATSWGPVGPLPGIPQALLATDDQLWVAASGEEEVTGIYRSDDEGASWDLEYRDEV